MIKESHTVASSTLSDDQANALDRIADWYKGVDGNVVHCDGGREDCPEFPHTHGEGHAPVFSLGGWAGTGKTTLMRQLEGELGIRTAFGTPTHKAAAVLRKKLTGTQINRVRTYHSLIYVMHAIYRCEISGQQVRKLVDVCACKQEDACECPSRFEPCGMRHTCHIREQLDPQRREHLGGHRDIVIIDESSMLSREQVEDVRSFGVPVLLVGDHGQLPPVKADMNPWTRNPDVELTQIHRQGADSGVLLAAHEVRRTGGLSGVSYGRGDAVRIHKDDEVTDGLFGRFTPGPQRAVIAHTNAMRATINRMYHGDGDVHEGDRVVALGGRSYDAARVRLKDGQISPVGDFIMVHNGMSGEIIWHKADGAASLSLVIKLDNHVLATEDDPVCVLVSNVPRAQFGAEKDLPWNSNLRPRGSKLWDYAYALTAYKAQGSEFDQVIVLDQHAPSYAQWMYTAITRAKDKLIMVDFARR